MNAPADSYPLRFDVDYPDRPLNRLTTFFRLFTVIPILIVLACIDASFTMQYFSDSFFEWAQVKGWNRGVYSGLGLLFVPALLMLLFRRKYPRWWFDWNLELLRFSSRISAYLGLLRDEYPSTTRNRPFTSTSIIQMPEQDLNRWLPLIKWFLAIPHYIVLTLLGVVVLLCLIGAWFAILFTGHYPRALFDLVVGFNRWWLRVIAYAFILVTDQYPPFRLSD